MLKLVYHTHVLGPIDLEFDKTLVRVGSSEDNDLVLRHPSIQPRHCLLVFHGEALFYLAPGQEEAWQTVVEQMAGSEFNLGDTLCIGEVPFSLQHSSKTVSLPKPFAGGPGSLASLVAAKPEALGNPHKRPYYCPHCRSFLAEENLKQVGLVGHMKHRLCAKCGRAVEAAAGVQRGSAAP